MNTKKNTTLVLGASENPARYSYLALRKLMRHGKPVAAVGKKQGMVDGVVIEKETKPFEDIDTITLYLNPKNQEQYYDYMVSLKPRRIIFNPGTENEDLYAIARKNNIEVVEGCTLVMLGTGQY